MGSSMDAGTAAQIKQIQPIVTGLGTIIGGVGALMTVGLALNTLSAG